MKTVIWASGSGGGHCFDLPVDFAENDPQKSCSGLNKSREVYFYGKKDFMKKYFLEIYFFNILEIARRRKSNIQKAQMENRSKNARFLGCFFYDTPFKNCIFSMAALIARRSRYDFWIPDKMLTLETKIQIIFFEVENVDRKKIWFFFEPFFFLSKNPKIDFFDFWIG